MQLDSIITIENEKLKQMDTILNVSTAKIDSLTNKGNKIIEKFKN